MDAVQTPATLKLILEDKGQDFLYFVVQGDLILKAGPFQNWAWKGRRLTASKFAPGDELVFTDGRTLNYRVDRVEPMPPGWEAPSWQ